MKKIAAAVSLVAVAACVRTNAALMDPSVHLAPTCSDAVRLYTSADQVGQPYQQVALLNSSGESSWSDESGMIKSMRTKAAEVGANGIILNAIDEPSALTKVIGDVAKTGTVRKGKSVAIFIPAEAVKSRNACDAQAKKK
ncbi:MAG TPA: hypothetical protein VGO75_02375 [Gemmatimonadaceae bacterium]|jgi:hypothetical protein|nr:hypothetical protein [Gemmatimonadaceae bacterium]